MLSAIYGECKTHRQFPWPANPEAYADTAIGSALQRIRDALAGLRGHRDFIKSAQMPPCDYFIADPPFIVEFDESQHFSRPRWVALAHYPEQIAVGFSVAHWQELCCEIDSVDDAPVDRDERRAWYDSLRDLLPLVHGFKPTVRLYAEETQWCAFAVSARDITTFQTLIEQRLPPKTA